MRIKAETMVLILLKEKIRRTNKEVWCTDSILKFIDDFNELIKDDRHEI